MEVGDSAHCLCHQPDSPSAGLKAWAWGPEGPEGPGGLRAWLCLDDSLNICLKHSQAGDKTSISSSTRRHSLLQAYEAAPAHLGYFMYV